ncbi:MAG: BPSS1780 family membrane protein [Myxococcota bacterium]|nr:BPSS1780 family membrane protein [Myxococcota bacterium]
MEKSDWHAESVPNADASEPNRTNQLVLHPPRAVSVGQGWQWVVGGFGHFRKDIGTWIAICALGFLIIIAWSFIPILNMGVSLSSYVWIGGLLIGCKAQDDGEPLALGHLFAGFKAKFGPLLLLALVSSVMGIAVFALCLGSFYFQILSASFNPEDASVFQELMSNLRELLLGYLVALALMIPVSMALFFAPALMIFNNVPLFSALGLSFMGCVKNILPFLIYGLVMLVFCIFAAIPLALGFLAFFPVCFGSSYVAYKDIYIS